MKKVNDTKLDLAKIHSYPERNICQIDVSETIVWFDYDQANLLSKILVKLNEKNSQIDVVNEL